MKLSFDDSIVSQTTLSYWENVLKLLACAGMYQSKIALRDNLRDKDISWKVEPVLTKYYDGSTRNLDLAIHRIEKKFHKLIPEINAECKRQKIVRITEPAKLLQLLRDKKRRDYYGREAKKCLAQNKIVPLQAFERDFIKKQGQA